jgi:hypothetical protein
MGAITCAKIRLSTSRPVCLITIALCHRLPVIFFTLVLSLQRYTMKAGTQRPVASEKMRLTMTEGISHPRAPAIWTSRILMAEGGTCRLSSTCGGAWEACRQVEEYRDRHRWFFTSLLMFTSLKVGRGGYEQRGSSWYCFFHREVFSCSLEYQL